MNLTILKTQAEEAPSLCVHFCHLSTFRIRLLSELIHKVPNMQVCCVSQRVPTLAEQFNNLHKLQFTH